MELLKAILLLFLLAVISTSAYDTETENARVHNNFMEQCVKICRETRTKNQDPKYPVSSCEKECGADIPQIQEVVKLNYDLCLEQCESEKKATDCPKYCEDWHAKYWHRSWKG